MGLVNGSGTWISRWCRVSDKDLDVDRRQAGVSLVFLISRGYSHDKIAALLGYFYR